MADEHFPLCPLLLNSMQSGPHATDLTALFNEVYGHLCVNYQKALRRQFLDLVIQTYLHHSQLQRISLEESHKDGSVVSNVRENIALYTGRRVPSIDCLCLSNQKIVGKLLVSYDEKANDEGLKRLHDAAKTQSFKSGRGCQTILHIVLPFSDRCFTGERPHFALPVVVKLILDAGVDVLAPDSRDGSTAINVLVKLISRMFMPPDSVARTRLPMILDTARILLDAMPLQTNRSSIDIALQYLTHLMFPINFPNLSIIRGWASQLCLITDLSKMLIEYGATAGNHTSRSAWVYASETIRELEKRGSLPGILKLSNDILNCFQRHIHFLRLVSEGTVFSDEFWLKDNGIVESSLNLTFSIGSLFKNVSFVKIFVQIAQYSSTGSDRSHKLIKCFLNNLSANGVIYLRRKLSDKESTIDPEHVKKSLMWLANIENPFSLKQLACRVIRSRMAHTSMDGVEKLQVPKELKRYLLAN